jgi:hypothetical protein
MRYHPTRNSAAWHLLAQVGTWHTALSGRDTARGETRARPGCYARAEQRFRPMRYHPTRIFSARCFGKRGCGQLDRTMLIEVSMAGEPSVSAIGDAGHFRAARLCGDRQARILRVGSFVVRPGTADSLSANLVAGASFDLGSGAQTSAQLPEPRQAQSCGSGCSFDPGSGEAALRRFGNRESCE